MERNIGEVLENNKIKLELRKRTAETEYPVNETLIATINVESECGGTVPERTGTRDEMKNVHKKLVDILGADDDFIKDDADKDDVDNIFKKIIKTIKKNDIGFVVINISCHSSIDPQTNSRVICLKDDSKYNIVPKITEVRKALDAKGTNPGIPLALFIQVISFR